MFWVQSSKNIQIQSLILQILVGSPNRNPSDSRSLRQSISFLAFTFEPSIACLSPRSHKEQVNPKSFFTNSLTTAWDSLQLPSHFMPMDQQTPNTILFVFWLVAFGIGFLLFFFVFLAFLVPFLRDRTQKWNPKMVWRSYPWWLVWEGPWQRFSYPRVRKAKLNASWLWLFIAQRFYLLPTVSAHTPLSLAGYSTSHFFPVLDFRGYKIYEYYTSDWILHKGSFRFQISVLSDVFLGRNK